MKEVIMTCHNCKKEFSEEEETILNKKTGIISVQFILDRSGRMEWFLC